jgi:hypothetical protein
MVAEMMVAQQKLKTFVICKVQQGHRMWRVGAVGLRGGEPGVGEVGFMGTEHVCRAV